MWETAKDETYEKCQDAEELIHELFKAFDKIYKRVDGNSHTYDRMMAEFVCAIRRAGKMKGERNGN